MAHADSTTAAGRGKKKLLIVVLMTLTYLVAEVVGSIITGSLALLADAGHMLTDVAGLILALVAITLGEKKANAKFTYGYSRSEILAALANAVILIVVSIYILFEAWERVRTPSEIDSVPMLAIAAIGLVVNLIGMFILRDSSSESLNMRGAYFEVLSDMLTSVGVMIGAVLIYLTGKQWIDPLISAGIGLLILPRTWHLLREAIGILLEGVPSGIEVAALRKEIEQLPEVAAVHDLHVWTLTSGLNAMTAHIYKSDGADESKIIREVRSMAENEFGIKHTTIQVEGPGEAHPGNSEHD